MFDPKQKTFMQYTLEQELRNFHSSNVQSDVHTDSSDDFKDGNILFKIPIKKKFMDDMLLTLRNPVHSSRMDHEVLSNNFHDARHENGLFENVTEKIIEIPANATYAECIETIISFKNELKENFYGAILRSKGIIINPFHILTALSVLEQEEYLAKKYNIIIFAYRDREQLNIFTQNHVSDSELVNKNIDALMHAYISKIPTVTRMIKDEDSRIHPTDTSIRVVKQTKKFADEDPDCSHYISGSQLLTRGILAPFYGVSLIKMNGDTSGLRLTPFGSCNIGCDDSKPIPNPNPWYDTVCTGSSNKRTLQGLRTLSHAYLGSPFGGGFIQNGALNYADIMIERAISLYEDAEIIKKDINIPLELAEPEEDVESYSEDELECETLYEYLKLAARTLGLPKTAKLARERYREMKLWKESQGTTDCVDAQEEGTFPFGERATTVHISTPAGQADPLYRAWSAASIENTPRTVFRQEFMLEQIGSLTDQVAPTIANVTNEQVQVTTEMIQEIQETVRNQLEAASMPLVSQTQATTDVSIPFPTVTETAVVATDEHVEEVYEWDYQVFTEVPDSNDFQENDRIFINWGSTILDNDDNTTPQNNSSIYQIVDGRWKYLSEETLERRLYLEGQTNV